jgi:hypothetical protein
MRDEAGAGDDRLVVDLLGETGLVRSTLATTATRLELAVGPVIKSLGETMTSLRDAPDSRSIRPARCVAGN